MQLYINMKNTRILPRRDELKKIMWEGAFNVSQALDLQKFHNLMLSWDKWIDDTRWSNGLPKSYEHINFELINKKLIVIEVDENALFIDKRACYKSAILIAERTHGKISTDNLNWITANVFSEHAKDYLKYSFDEAVEISFKEVVS